MSLRDIELASGLPNMKSHRGAADVLAEMARRQNRPVTVTFQVTDRCNYDCVHCYQTQASPESPEFKDAELSFDEIARILRELADFGVLFLTLMGGEFFVRRDADDILRLAHDLGFAIKLLTTGHHVHERRADLIASLRPIQVDMSMYAATPHRHDAITRQEGSWERTSAAARRLIERRVPVLLKAPVMEHNAGELADLARLARSLGAETSFDAKVTGKEDGDQHPAALRMSAATLRAFYRGGPGAGSHGGDAGGDADGHDNGIGDFLAATYADFDPAQELRPLHHTPCRAGQQAVSINPQGKVWPCNALPIECGDLRVQSFAEIWSGSRPLDEVRQLRWAEIADCNVCGLRSYCQRCHGMALLEQGALRGPSLEACRHAVAVRDSLRERGLIPDTETALPPTWDRIDPDGQHHLRSQAHLAALPEASTSIRRSAALRVLP